MPNPKIFFIINPFAGNKKADWLTLINDYFAKLSFDLEFHFLTKVINKNAIKNKIKIFSPHIVVAVGGDGTINLAAENLLETNIQLGIIPAGSANGLAKELNIPLSPSLAMDLIVKGHTKKIHAISVNNQLCIHLSDIGLNAYGMKKFKHIPGRGMWGYFIAALKVIWQNVPMKIELMIDQKTKTLTAVMVVIANGTQYGTGAVINPIGRLDDELFEVIVVKKISFQEMFKMVFSHSTFDSSKTELFQTNQLLIKSVKKVHFQIDGDYQGKVTEVIARLIPNTLEIIVPFAVK